LTIWFVVISKEKREDGKSKKEVKRQSLLGGSGDKVVDDQQKKGGEDESTSMEDCLSPIGDSGVSVAREDIQSGALASTPVPKPVVRCKFHGGAVKYKVCHISLSPNSQPSAFYSIILSSRRSSTANIAIV
jgi:hypothetical protein